MFKIVKEAIEVASAIGGEVLRINVKSEFVSPNLHPSYTFENHMNRRRYK